MGNVAATLVEPREPIEPVQIERLGAENLPPNDLADMLLLLLARRTGFAFAVTPAEVHATVAVTTRDTTWLAAVMAPQPAQALVVRIGALAGLDLSAVDQVGCLRVRVGDRERELMVRIHHGRDGFSADVRRVADLDDEAVPTPVAGFDDEVTSKLCQRVGGYRLIRELGRGAMGVVYLGEHETINKHVAIKVISDQLVGNAVAVSRFLREARAAASIRHPGIVDVTDFGILPDGRPFLAMELVEAPTLEDLIRNGPMEPARAIRIAIQIADAIAAAHAVGVVHRDLKPANVFVSRPDDRVKIGDFGAAKMIGRDLQGSPIGANVEVEKSIILGTPLYMAPEQAQGVIVDGRCDVYALGCILFEMVSGHPPFEDETAREVIMRHITEPIPRLVSEGGEMPRGLEAIVRRALAKSRGRRIPSAEEFARQLLGLLQPEPAVPPKSLWRRWFAS